MSTNKTPNYEMHSWVESDYIKRIEMNENFDKLDTELFSLSESAVKKGEYGIGGNAKDFTGGNANDITDSGIFAGHTLSGTPFTAGTIVHSEYFEEGYAVQHFYPATSGDKNIYYRKKVANVWETWTTVVKQGDFGLGGTAVQETVDLNNLNKTGTYHCLPNTLNSPNSANSYVVQHTQIDATHGYQMAFRDANYVYNEIYVRRKVINGSWDNWRVLLTENERPFLQRFSLPHGVSMQGGSVYEKLDLQGLTDKNINSFGEYVIPVTGQYVFTANLQYTGLTVDLTNNVFLKIKINTTEVNMAFDTTKLATKTLVSSYGGDFKKGDKVTFLVAATYGGSIQVSTWNNILVQCLQVAENGQQGAPNIPGQYFI